jgi:hypothetical protein
MSDDVEVLRRIYALFNGRDIERIPDDRADGNSDMASGELNVAAADRGHAQQVISLFSSGPSLAV